MALRSTPLLRHVLVTGGTGYIGRRLIARLLERGHRVRVLARAASIDRVPRGAQAVVGDALDAESIHDALRDGDTLVHLVGTPHPSPSKAAEFTRVDLASVLAATDAARRRAIAQMIYVSVAQPAPAMHAYVAARATGERAIREAALTATILRPWYVLGPGHWWPLVLLPMYAVAQLVPPFREGARRLGLVTLNAMVTALVASVETPPTRGTIATVDVPGIRSARLV